jgi:FAD/FMN-containing dehydrogenase
MTTMQPTGIPETARAALRRQVQGTVIAPGDPAYDQARRVWNGLIDKHPALILRCQQVADVQAGIAFARAWQLPLAVRGGGHNVAGFGTCDDGLVLDLAPLKRCVVEPAARLAHAEPGLTWGEFDQATTAHGLATPGGLVSSTGIAGFTLGGGLGWLSRLSGLACDNLVAAQVVTADGTVVETDATQEPDLLWGLRGGGGNFGVVTRFTYRLHPLGPLYGGQVAYPAEAAPAVLQAFQVITESAPDPLSLALAFLDVPDGGPPVIAAAVCYVGPAAEAERLLAPLLRLGTPLLRHLGPTSYGELQTMLDPINPPGLYHYWRSGFLPRLDAVIQEIVVHYGNHRPTPLSSIHVQHLGGAIARVDPASSAFAHRDDPYLYNILAIWTDPAEEERCLDWLHRCSEALQAHGRGTYVNFMMSGEGGERVRLAYGPHYERLVALKRRYDPTNLFRLNQNIRP